MRLRFRLLFLRVIWMSSFVYRLLIWLMICIVVRLFMRGRLMGCRMLGSVLRRRLLVLFTSRRKRARLFLSSPLWILLLLARRATLLLVLRMRVSYELAILRLVRMGA